MYLYMASDSVSAFSRPLQEISVANVENEGSQTLLQTSQVTSQLKLLQQSLDGQAATMQKQNELISHSEAEITRNNALIERKQTQIDQLNKKIDQKLNKMEGVRIKRLSAGCRLKLKLILVPGPHSWRRHLSDCVAWE